MQKNCNLDICHNRTRNSKKFISSRKYPSAMCLAGELSVWKISVEEVSVRNVSGRRSDLRRRARGRCVWSRKYALGMCLVVKISLVEVSVGEISVGEVPGNHREGFLLMLNTIRHFLSTEWLWGREINDEWFLDHWATEGHFPLLMSAQEPFAIVVASFIWGKDWSLKKGHQKPRK